MLPSERILGCGNTPAYCVIKNGAKPKQDWAQDDLHDPGESFLQVIGVRASPSNLAGGGHEQEIHTQNRSGNSGADLLAPPKVTHCLVMPNIAERLCPSSPAMPLFLGRGPLRT